VVSTAVERFFHTGEVAINYAEWPVPAAPSRPPAVRPESALAGRGPSAALGARDGEKAPVAPPLLLMHGLSGRWQNWEAVVPAMTQRWHVYAIDLRGHGRSGHSVGVYDRAAYSKDTASFIEEVIGGPAHLIGHSLSGLTVLGVAADRADLVRAFVMEDPPLFVRDRWESTPEPARFAVMRELAESGLSVEQIAARISEQMPQATPEACRNRAECIFQMDHRVWDGVFGRRYAGEADSVPVLKGATPPALLLQAEPALCGRSTL